MSAPFLLFENIFASGTLGSTGDEPGWPKENVLDWRVGTSYRWKPDDTSEYQQITVDLGASSGNWMTADYVACGGHNLGDDPGATWNTRYSDNGADWTGLHAAKSFTDNKPFAVALNSPAQTPHRYWGVIIYSGGGAWTTLPQIGVLTLGRALSFGRLRASADPYGETLQGQIVNSRSGALLGSNVKYVQKKIRLAYDDAGLARDTFFKPSSGIGFDIDFIPHHRSGKPFWFVWNYDEEPTDVWLSIVDGGIRAPFQNKVLYRKLNMTIRSYVEL